MGHWIIYYIKDGVYYFFGSFGQPLDMYGLDIEPFYTTYTKIYVKYIKEKLFNSPLQDIDVEPTLYISHA